MKCTRGKGSASAVLQQSHQRGMEEVEFGSAPHFCAPFLGGVGGRGCPCPPGTALGAGSRCLDLANLSFQFISELTDIPSHFLFVQCAHSSWWVKPSQCETPLRALLWQHWKEGRNTAGQSLSHGCCLLWSRFGLKCWLPAGGDFTQDGLWAWGSDQDLLFVSSLNDQAGVSASHLLLCQIPHWITLSPVLTFRRSFFWHKCQEMLLEMKILINIVQDLNCNFSLLGSSYLGSLHLVLRHCASPSPSHQYLWKCF